MDNGSKLKELAAVAAEASIEHSKSLLKELHQIMILSGCHTVTREQLRQIAYAAINDEVEGGDPADMETAADVKADIAKIDMAELFPDLS